MGPKPSVGRIVHYYHANPANVLDRPCAAIITDVAIESVGYVDLAVFWSGLASVTPIVGVEFREEPTPGCWSWPPRT